MAVIERATQMLVVRSFFKQEAAQTRRNETKATNFKNGDLIEVPNLK
jgi:hypothetical protein